MERWERRLYTVSMALTIAATALPLLCQSSRLLGLENLASLFSFSFAGDLGLFAALILPLYATPVLVVWGICYSVALRLRMRSRGQDGSATPSALVFALCGVAWVFVWYSFKLLPLFAGETPVHRVFIDGWLDRLL